SSAARRFAGAWKSTTEREGGLVAVAESADYQELSHDDYQELSYDLEGHVGVITLRRPEARNALTYRTYRELEDAVRSTSARCLVITGEDPAFCSGDDVKMIMAGGEKPPEPVTAEDRKPRLTPAAAALPS